jgi:O-antigen/teichoic acid export membrane protein
MKRLQLTESSINSKHLSRVKQIIFSGLNAAVSPISSLLISYIVVHNYGPNLWGSFIKQLLWLNVAAHVAAFGSKEFLIRKFANDPSAYYQCWQNSFNARFNFIILFALAILLLKLNTQTCFTLIGWLLCRFIYQSYDPLIAWHRKFSVNILCELAGGLVIVLMILIFKKYLSALLLLQLFSLAEFLKFAIVAIYFRIDVTPLPKFTFDFTHLKDSSFFFLIGFAGLLHSRVDQLIATKYLLPSSLAYYQILMSLLLIFQSIAYFVIQPFLKNLYRLHIDSIKQLGIKLFIFGSLVCPFLLLGAGFILSHFYSFTFTPFLLIAGYFFVLPFFYYMPYIYYLYKSQKESNVLLVNLTIVLLNLLCLPFIFPKFGLEGALTFSAILQTIQAFTFRILAIK